MAKKRKPDKTYALQLAYDTLVDAIKDPESTPAQRIRAAKELAAIAINLPDADATDALTDFLAENG